MSDNQDQVVNRAQDFGKLQAQLEDAVNKMQRTITVLAEQRNSVLDQLATTTVNAQVLGEERDKFAKALETARLELEEVKAKNEANGQNMAKKVVGLSAAKEELEAEVLKLRVELDKANNRAKAKPKAKAKAKPKESEN